VPRLALAAFLGAVRMAVGAPTHGGRRVRMVNVLPNGYEHLWLSRVVARRTTNTTKPLVHHDSLLDFVMVCCGLHYEPLDFHCHVDRHGFDAHRRECVAARSREQRRKSACLLLRWM
jgi:hypothetical protein